jgi:hypothetical protein
MPTGFRTIGGGGGDSPTRSRRGPLSANPTITNFTTFSESEERMVGEIKMQDLKSSTFLVSDNPPPDGIMVSNQVEVTREDVDERSRRLPVQRVYESW